MQSKDINIVLVGGIFSQGASFIDKIISNNKLVDFLKETEKSIIIKDKSKDNIAFEVAKMILKNKIDFIT